MSINNNNLPAVFNYEGKQVRSVKIDGEAWFVAKDVCDILEIADVSTATRDFDGGQVACVAVHSDNSFLFSHTAKHWQGINAKRVFRIFL